MSKDTLQLPKTSFSMKANLPHKEPEILKKWERLKIFEKLRKSSKGKEKFVLHDGPPYANGHIHMGTALNKILKDMITRFHQMHGKDSVYVPGWDCHGLPIEWKIEEQYKKKKKNKDEVPIKDFRQECREFAKNWIDIHIKEFKRLGVVGDFENYYSTMSFEAEAQIVRELGKFLLDGSLYQGFKPVLWSTVEKTALADAEVEYMDHTSNTIYVPFKIKETEKMIGIPSHVETDYITVESINFSNFLKFLDVKKYESYLLERYKKGAPATPKPQFDFKPAFEDRTILNDLKSIKQLDDEHPAKQYVIGRKIPSEFYDKLYFCDKFGALVNKVKPKTYGDKDHPRLVIPFYDTTGKLFAFQGRAFGKEQPKYLTVKLDENKQKYLDILIKLRNYNCSRYYELFVRGTIIQGY